MLEKFFAAAGFVVCLALLMQMAWAGWQARGHGRKPPKPMPGAGWRAWLRRARPAARRDAADAAREAILRAQGSAGTVGREGNVIRPTGFGAKRDDDEPPRTLH